MLGGAIFQKIFSMPNSAMSDHEPLLDRSDASTAQATSFRDQYDNFEWNDSSKGVYYIRNVLHLALGFFLSFTAFNGIQNLSTSIVVGSLGKISPAVLYIVFTINCLLGPSIVNKFGVRGSLVFAFACLNYFGVAYLVALLLPKSCGTEGNETYCSGTNSLRWALVMSSACLFGFAASPNWVAQGSYMTANARKLCEKWAARGLIDYDANTTDLPVMGFLNGIFWMFMQLTQVTGNIVPSLMLNEGAKNWQIFIVYLVFGVLGLVLISSLRPMEVEKKPTNVSKDVSDMLGLWSDPRLFLLIPIIMYNGLEQGWIWGDFTATIVKSSLGQKNIGFVMTVFGVSNAAFSFGFGKLSDTIGRFSVILVGCIAQLFVAGLVIFHMKGTFDVVGDDDAFRAEGAPGWGLIIAMAALWAVGDASLNTQLYSIISETFGDQAEAGFANFKLFQSLMISVSFAFPVMGITYESRSTIFAIVCIVGLVCLAILEFCGLKEKKQAVLDLGEEEEDTVNALHKPQS